MPSFGREKITTDVEAITKDNVVDVLYCALCAHGRNAVQTARLFDFYRGKQPIFDRKKDVRPEIKNFCVLNHANEIVSFKVSYLLSSPITYVSAGKEDVADGINELNAYMRLAMKPTRDKELADDFNICGNAYRMILPNKRELTEDEAPFELFRLDPKSTFVIYHNGVGEKAICGVTFVTNADGKTVYSVYTDDMYYEIVDRAVARLEPHALGVVPIFEYKNNNFKLGSFEIVETLLNAINALASNRVDATEQAVQALMVFENCDIESEQYDEMRKKGAIRIKSADGEKSKVYSIGTDLNQADQQVLMDALYDAVIKICGMPALSNGGSSDSSNNGATITRNGWYHAEARAKDTELLWNESEMRVLKLVLRICRDLGKNPLQLSLKDVDIKFTRRNYEDLLSKSQTFTTLMSTGYTDVTDAYTASGLFADSEGAATRGKAWHEMALPKEQIKTEVPIQNAAPKIKEREDGNEERG